MTSETDVHEKSKEALKLEFPECENYITNYYNCQKILASRPNGDEKMCNSTKGEMTFCILCLYGLY